jgi:hypothetical protein
MHDDFYRHDVDFFRNLFADLLQIFAAAGTLLLCGVDIVQDFLARNGFWERLAASDFAFMRFDLRKFRIRLFRSYRFGFVEKTLGLTRKLFAFARELQRFEIRNQIAKVLYFLVFCGKLCPDIFLRRRRQCCDIKFDFVLKHRK